MKNFKKYLTVLAAIAILGATTTAFALDIKTPADIVSGLTGKTVAAVSEERAAGKTYGTIAKDAGKLDEFKAQNLEQKKALLDQRVKDGVLTQKQADDAYNAIKTNQATCDGTGKAAIGKKLGSGFGQGKGMGIGKGQSAGRGMGNGQCNGMGMKNGGGYGAGCTMN